VSGLSDAVVAHLCRVAGGTEPDAGRYELLAVIGRGGMGTVYRARDRALARDVALKVLADAADAAAIEARLANEAHVIARLEHPNIIPVYDHGVLPDGRRFYAMKLVRGQRLDEQVDRATPLADRLTIFQKVCDAVAFAHAHGVVHRDLKPPNVMLGPFGEVLVLDWGLAKELGCAASPASVAAGVAVTGTDHGTVLGTPGYMAPEQAQGSTVDERTDVYALGGILYFLLTGRPPLPQGQGESPSPRRLDRTIPRPLEAVCLKALAPDRADRYAGVLELAADLADFRAGRRVRAYPEGLRDKVLRLARKYQTALALVVAYLLMRLALLFFAGA
jgi:serine/threonine protein kinase